jgi:class 3 adenylate cyclase
MFTFLFTDIEGSTAPLQRTGGDVYARVLAGHHELIRLALAAHGGSELNTAGDGFFDGFSSPRACVAAAVEMQQALGSHAWPGGEQVRVRMGVHAGEAQPTAAGPVGLDVHRAARIAAVAHGGQVLVSETAAALVRGALPPDAGLRDLGWHRLKDLGRNRSSSCARRACRRSSRRCGRWVTRRCQQLASPASHVHRPRPRDR